MLAYRLPALYCLCFLFLSPMLHGQIATSVIRTLVLVTVTTVVSECVLQLKLGMKSFEYGQRSFTLHGFPLSKQQQTMLAYSIATP